MRQATVRGALLGVISGGLLALIYGVAVLLLFLINRLVSEALDVNEIGDLARVLAVLVILPMGMIVVFGIGVIPGALLGLVTGVLIGLLLDLSGAGLPRITAAALGGVVAFSVTLLVHFVAWRTTADGALSGVTSERVLDYLLFLGVPSVIYLITSGWMGWWLNRHQV